MELFGPCGCFLLRPAAVGWFGHGGHFPTEKGGDQGEILHENHGEDQENMAFWFGRDVLCLRVSPHVIFREFSGNKIARVVVAGRALQAHHRVSSAECPQSRARPEPRGMRKCCRK